jgi:PTH1 family peptidyl-tRNA hydrolase
MKLIVGLGNPGTQYEKTRHNAGFLAVDRLAAKLAKAASPLVRQRFGAESVELAFANEKLMLLKPMRFMNCSGQSVAEAVGFYKLDPASDLLVLVDDYALPVGSIRLRAEGSAGGHNGLSDIERALGRTTYPRLRIGIDAPPPGFSDPADWVLGRFTPEQLSALSPVLDTVVDATCTFITQGLTPAMNRFNVRPRPPATPQTAQPTTSPAPSAAPASTTPLPRPSPASTGSPRLSSNA